jgi:hypothetical protein
VIPRHSASGSQRWNTSRLSVSFIALDYVAKITQEVNSFDNVILEVCDEAPDIGFPPTPLAEAGAWVDRLAEVATNAERGLPKKHLVAVQVEGPVGGSVGFVDQTERVRHHYTVRLAGGISDGRNASSGARVPP